MLRKRARSILQKIVNSNMPKIEQWYLHFDRRHIYRANNTLLIPAYANRRGGKRAYAEWAHVIGIFQTLIYQELNQKSGNRILDVGCGTGLLGIATDSFIREEGAYVGIDVSQQDIDFCQSHYKKPNWYFYHLNVQNAAYTPNQPNQMAQWPVKENDFELVTALSVWTHMRPQDATFYFKEIDRVLKPGGKAIVTFFLLDDDYEQSLSSRNETTGRFHNTLQTLWVFDQSHSECVEWHYPAWVNTPEEAIGITPVGIQMLLRDTTLKLLQIYPGNWKEQPGIFFQDILVFQKQSISG